MQFGSSSTYTAMCTATTTSNPKLQYTVNIQYSHGCIRSSCKGFLKSLVSRGRREQPSLLSSCLVWICVRCTGGVRWAWPVGCMQAGLGVARYHCPAVVMLGCGMAGGCVVVA